MKTLILTLMFLFLAVVMLAIKVLFVKGGKFPSGHVHDIGALRDKGVRCGRDQ